MTDKYDPDTGGKLVVCQVGAIRMVGEVPMISIESSDGTVELHNAGAVVTQRGAMPGQIAGTMLMTKSVSIVSLDFCKGPLKKIEINPDMKYEVTEDFMEAEDIAVFIDNYNRFLSGEATALVSQGGNVP